jgi:NTE family protein
MNSERCTFIGLAGVRVKLAKKNYVSAMANILMQSDELLNYEMYSPIWGFGFGYSYDSRIGPLDFTIGYSTWYEKPTITANIGLWF